MKLKKDFKTIVLSDIHLGSRWSKAKDVKRFLENNTCETLILCGDIIDGWYLARGRKNKWKREHTDFLKLLLKLQYTTKIVYLRGNHDDFLENILPLQFQNISFVEDYIHVSGDKTFYVLHGDVFDTVTTKYSWLSKVGDVGYTFLLWLNQYYNKYREKKGLMYYSISREVKAKIKTSVSYISSYEEHIVSVAKEKNCDGVICGHIHHPEKKYYEDILYLNSGDWVESLSALTEDKNGNWDVVFYEAKEPINNSVGEVYENATELVPELEAV